MSLTATRHPYQRVGRWVAVGITGVLLAAVVPAADAAAPTSLVGPLPSEPTSTTRCRDFSVVRVNIAARGPHLLVSALCLVQPGEHVQLRRHNPQGINPRDLLLELVVSRSPFPDGPASRDEPIVALERDLGFATVTILPDGPTLHVGLPA
jgi:hypothetical protein